MCLLSGSRVTLADTALLAGEHRDKPTAARVKSRQAPGQAPGSPDTCGVICHLAYGTRHQAVQTIVRSPGTWHKAAGTKQSRLLRVTWPRSRLQGTWPVVSKAQVCFTHHRVHRPRHWALGIVMAVSRHNKIWHQASGFRQEVLHHQGQDIKSHDGVLHGDKMSAQL